MTTPPKSWDTPRDPNAIPATQLQLYNHPRFQKAARLVYEAEKELCRIMTRRDAYFWIRTWASGAGDGSV